MYAKWNPVYIPSGETKTDSLGSRDLCLFGFTGSNQHNRSIESSVHKHEDFYGGSGQPPNLLDATQLLLDLWAKFKNSVYCLYTYIYIYLEEAL